VLPNNLIWFFYTCPKQDGIFGVVVHLGGDKVYEPSPPPQGTLYHFQNGEPTSVTLGQDQNIWATEKEDKIARITQLGEFTELPVTPGSFPYDLTSGPDGNI